jgi:hypothetical protein
MKKHLFIVALAILCCSCAGIIAATLGMSQEDSAYRIKPKNVGENRAVAVFYSYNYLKEKEDKNAEIEMRESDYRFIPKNGYISIRIQGWTASSANTKNWLFILQDSNKNEIYRDYGEDSRPRGQINDLGSSYNTTWSNLHTIYLKDDYIFPLYLRVIDALKTPIDITIMKK